MLIKFRVKNHRSIRDEQTLVLTNDLRESPPRVIEISGGTGSGKSNLLDALEFMSMMVLNSAGFNESELMGRCIGETGVPLTPFCTAPYSDSDEPSLFEATFIHFGIRHQYGFVVDHHHVLREWLYVWPRGRMQVWYERSGDEYKFGRSLGGGIRKNRVIARGTDRNSLFLSLAARSNHAQLLDVYRWFRDMSTSVETVGRKDVDAIQSLFSTLSALDIVDVKAATPLRGYGNEILVGRRLGNSTVWVQLEQESRGIQALAHLAPGIKDALDRGGVMLADDLDTLDPGIARRVVLLFTTPTNQNGAQLVFTAKHGFDATYDLAGVERRRVEKRACVTTIHH